MRVIRLLTVVGAMAGILAGCGNRGVGLPGDGRDKSPKDPPDAISQPCGTPGVDCIITVQVVPREQGQPCEVSATAPDQLDVMASNTKVTWRLQAAVLGNKRLRFQPTTGGKEAIDIVGASAKDFTDAVSETPGQDITNATGVVTSLSRTADPQSKHDRKLFHYNVSVDIEDGAGGWTSCKRLDPLIVNRG